MTVRESVIIDGNKYIWDGQVFREEKEAKTQARKYLRQGFKLHMKNKNGQFYIYRYRYAVFSCKHCRVRART